MLLGVSISFFSDYYLLAIKRSKEDSNATPIGRPPVNTVDSGMDPFAGSSKKAKPKKPRGKICKSDISAPSDFRHLSHVGFDPATGAFDVSHTPSSSLIIIHSYSNYRAATSHRTGRSCWILLV